MMFPFGCQNDERRVQTKELRMCVLMPSTLAARMEKEADT
jgi:hypothetical protein